ncbi:F-box domain-containing protein [Metarhizium robertsii ARSEF 23]|uniref:F-box domain-containing protein n=1 Tax=Metarhizium robertsii (strain ARSEF 23 / ATCC MYA-3075) TaxID=655844 RepID=A0A0B2X7A0_METRA|nr:F-box domain-containing protein [Metarhizium robertsii ARSEF 23]KHO10788.1 F-box domain-containing protein [Metarhizium robertsii ARSEF 23]
MLSADTSDASASAPATLSRTTSTLTPPSSSASCTTSSSFVSSSSYDYERTPERRALNLSLNVYNTIRRVSALLPGVIIAVDAWWIKSDRLCRPGDAVSLCEGVLELTFPVALAAFLFDVATIIVNRLGIPGASTMPLVVSILCHFVLTFTCLICFAGLLYIFTRSVNFSWPAGVLFIVLVSSLGVLACAAFVYGVISWR